MARGRTASSLRLGARRARANDLFIKGYSNAEVARDIGVGADTVARYRKSYDESIGEQARANPAMLRDVIANTMRALQELEKVRESAWSDYERATSPAIKAQFLNVVLKAQDQRAKLFGLFGVKAEYFLHVAQVRDQQDKLITFMTSHLCPADRIKLEEFLVMEFAGELSDMPTADIDT
jgi:transposase-like protein